MERISLWVNCHVSIKGCHKQLFMNDSLLTKRYFFDSDPHRLIVVYDIHKNSDDKLILPS